MDVNSKNTRRKTSGEKNDATGMDWREFFERLASGHVRETGIDRRGPLARSIQE